MNLNYYGQPVIDAGEFDGLHYPAFVPAVGGLPPVCSCGWTRWQIEEGPRAGQWIELSEHLADMGEFAAA